jgi:hypothetical protein
MRPEVSAVCGTLVAQGPVRFGARWSWQVKFEPLGVNEIAATAFRRDRLVHSFASDASLREVLLAPVHGSPLSFQHALGP